MEYNVKTGLITTLRSGCLILGMFNRKPVSGLAAELDKATDGAITRVIKRGDFKGETGQALLLYDLPGILAQRVLLLGLGAEKDTTSITTANAFGAAIKLLNDSSAGDALALLPFGNEDKDVLYRTVRDCVQAAEAVVYRFDQCKSKVEKPKKPLNRLAFHVPERKLLAMASKATAHGQAIANGASYAKTLANLPGNICTPSYLADEARKIGRKFSSVKTTVLDEKQMEKLGMGALLSVSRGSRQPAKLIVMQYHGGKPGSAPVVLVGKGLTFDAGGISIKPSAAMDEMKYDMCGGASVLGTISACAELGLPLNVIGVVPSSENLPDGDANKPGDIVTSMSGKTIEVLNTDAEGRLILCDALTYIARFKPAVVIDIATLTGACIIALGHHASGLLANDDKLAEELLDAGEQSGDRAWRLPLWAEYQKQLESNFADMANIGGRPAGTITAACFLARFTEQYKWAHLDIAGTAWRSGGSEKGATGRPVPLLMQMLLKRAKLV